MRNKAKPKKEKTVMHPIGSRERRAGPKADEPVEEKIKVNAEPKKKGKSKAKLARLSD